MEDRGFYVFVTEIIINRKTKRITRQRQGMMGKAEAKKYTNKKISGKGRK